MKFLSNLLFLSTVGLQQAFAEDSHAWPIIKEEPLLPINDPFYVPPETVGGIPWNETHRGKILNKREVRVSPDLGFDFSEAKAYQLLYHTRDVNDKSDASVTTVIVPPFPNRKRVLSVQNAYDSPDINCSPSYGLQFRAKGWSQFWNRIGLSFVAPYLMKGPILNIPDYEGSNAAFGVGPQSGYQTLDSIRAVMEDQDNTEIDEDAKVIMFGYSGGGLATEWATEIRAWYDPDHELPIIGAVIGGAPTNIEKTYHNVNNGKLSELDTWAMLGIMNAYPKMNTWMRNDLRTDAFQDKKFLLGLSRCGYEEFLADKLEYTNISAFFQNGDSFLDEFRDTIQEIGVMGQNITEENDPGFPLYFFYGTEDEVTAPIEDTENLIEAWDKAIKSKVYNVPLKDATHLDAPLVGMGLYIPWINLRFRYVEKHGIKKDMDSDEMFVDPEEMSATTLMHQGL